MPQASRATATIFALAAVIAGCEHNASSLGSPKASFDVTHIDLGEINAGHRPRDVRFRVTNDGIGDLKILHLVSSCSCSDAIGPGAPIPPGGHGEIVARITPERSGKNEAAVTAYVNDPERPKIPLRLTWNAVTALTAEPSELNLGRVRHGETFRQTLRLVSPADDPRPSIRRITCKPEKSLTAELAGDDRLEVSLVATELGGVPAGLVELHLDDADHSTLVIPVHWDVAERIRSTPKRLYLGTGSPGQPIAGRTLLRTEDGDLVLGSVTASGLSLLETAVDRPNNQTAVVTVKVKLPNVPGPCGGTIYVECTAPEATTVEIPVSAMVAPPDR